MSWLQALTGDTSWTRLLVMALDIFVVFYLIYRVLLIIRGTRAQQMVLGIAILGFAFFIAERLQMTTLSWILNSIISYFIIIIIVLFQQDIRRGLTRLGQVMQSGQSYQLVHVVDEVVSALMQLAKQRTGAIVVFEREAGISAFAEHGKDLDARVSRELVMALFVPSRINALHDGAVVVNKRLRISRAGVLLPLSQQVSLAGDLGTRHRAAIGITEETDAIALVVSEERGEVSLCLKGSIARDLEEEEVRNALSSLFDSEKETKKVEEEAKAAAEIGKAFAGLAGTVDEPSERGTHGKGS